MDNMVNLANLLFPKAKSCVISVKRTMSWKLAKHLRRMAWSNSTLSDPGSFVITVCLLFIFLLAANDEKSVRILNVF